ncbi:polysaccharide deacetylase family protein [Paenibacillus filicis]|uniref:Polysaccharide deacetylase family protein n=1 Tax=Paenibacillus gyeongsangnamensis TaxID=3388067 RepID=A0ABT4QDU2_9BACL|nr:polysaccharide deacetylase family protein [Paenibacillus filicis]MCZ8515049.1 polysaccharide deacetylase family protein [Paenibacillus filicis]
MKLYGASFLVRLGAASLIVPMLLVSGCQSSLPSNLPAKADMNNVQANEQPVTTEVQNLEVKPSQEKDIPSTPTDKIPDNPLGSEVGKPKEEANVVEASKTHKISALKPVYTVAKGTVAITIDDGPTRYTKELLKVLRENDAKVTFFFLGQNAAAYPQAVTEAVYDGNEIGYHSNSHPKMTSMTYDEQKKEFDLGLNKLQKLVAKPVKLFRPPYGAYNNDTKLVTEEHSMSMILWDEDPRDWSTTDSAAVVKQVLAQVKSGGIIVMHDHPSTIAALPDIIKGIKSKGMRLVTIPSR